MWIYCGWFDASNCCNCSDNSFLVDLFADIDECAEGTAGCAQNCHNSAGSFYCECRSGYQLGIDNKSCLGKLYDQFTPSTPSSHIFQVLTIIFLSHSISRFRSRKRTNYVARVNIHWNNIIILSWLTSDELLKNYFTSKTRNYLRKFITH